MKCEKCEKYYAADPRNEKKGYCKNGKVKRGHTLGEWICELEEVKTQKEEQ